GRAEALPRRADRLGTTARARCRAAGGAVRGGLRATRPTPAPPDRDLPGSERRAPMNLPVVLPALTSILALTFSLALFDQWRDRHGGFQLIWAIGMVFYGVG